MLLVLPSVDGSSESTYVRLHARARARAPLSKEQLARGACDRMHRSRSCARTSWHNMCVVLPRARCTATCVLYCHVRVVLARCGRSSTRLMIRSAPTPPIHAAYSMLHTTCIVQHATCCIQHATCCIQHATCIIQHATCIIQHATSTMARSGVRQSPPTTAATTTIAAAAMLLCFSVCFSFGPTAPVTFPPGSHHCNAAPLRLQLPRGRQGVARPRRAARSTQARNVP